MPNEKLIRHCRYCLQPIHRALYTVDTITAEFVGHWTHTRHKTKTMFTPAFQQTWFCTPTVATINGELFKATSNQLAEPLTLEQEVKIHQTQTKSRLLTAREEREFQKLLRGVQQEPTGRKFREAQ